MSSTVHLGNGRSMTFKGDDEYEDPTLATPGALKTEGVRVTFDRATYARLKLIAKAERKSLTDFIRSMAEERARVRSIYANGKHTT